MRFAGPVDGGHPPAGPASTGRSFWASFRRALLANTTGLAAAVAVGTLVTHARGGTLPFEPPTTADATVFWLIVVNNVSVLASLVLGAVTFGIYTSVTLAWNGYSLGAVLVSLQQEAPDQLPRVAPHIMLEFTAFLLGASAAWVLLVDGIGCLAAKHRVRVRGIATVLALAVACLLVAAWFEVRLINGDFWPWDTSFN